MTRLLRLATLVLLAALLGPRAGAAPPQFWRLEGSSDFLDGDLDGLSVDSEGHLRLGPLPQVRFDPQAPNAWCLARASDGTLYVGTGNEGRVVRVVGQKGSVLFDADELEVHAVAVGPDGRVYAGTSPDGAVYAIDASGQAVRFFDPEDKYIWALAFDAKGQLYVATGSQGRVYRVSPDGKGEVVLTTSETHVLSLAVDAGGRVYAGTAPEGIVYRLDGSGRAFVMVDSAFREIKALEVDASGDVYAAAAFARSAPTASRPAAPAAPGAPPGTPEVTVTESFTIVPAQGAAATAAPSAGAEAATPGAPRGALLRIRPTGEADPLWTSSDDLPYSLVRQAGSTLVGTGNKGKVYRVGDDGSWALLSTLPVAQVTALARAGAGFALVTSNPARVFALEDSPAPRGTFLSKPHDTETVSRWGRIAWEGTAPPGTEVQLETRAGNTENPDSTWTDWSAPVTRAAGEPIRSGPSRFLQLRMTLVAKDGRSPTVEAVSAAFLQRNRPPEVTSITVHPPGEVFQKPISVSGEPEILGLDPDPLDARTAAARPPAGSPPAISFSRKMQQRGLRTISWQAQDPNGDDLLFDILYRALGDTRWRPLRRRLTEPVFTWDTSSVPNGRYLLRVVASDAPGNPPALALTGSKDSPSFVVDNAPPMIEAGLDPARPGLIKATARDDASPIRRLEFSVDAGRWEEVAPVDGIGDSVEESYEIAIGKTDSPGPHVVVLRAIDQLGNVATARVDVP
jgi:sugar lactone lactonase YvrE